MHRLTGQCHCANIRIVIELAHAPGERAPRACDCDFCRKHGASYISDPRGSLRIDVEDARCLGRYRQGDAIADCLLCTRCGVLVGAVYQEGERLYATINTRMIDGDAGFAETKAVSPKLLSASDKIRRWKELWFTNVALIVHDA